MKLMSGLVIGAYLADIIMHPEGTSNVIWHMECAIEQRCPVCGYKLSHPVFTHYYPLERACRNGFRGVIWKRHLAITR